jgi:fibronectin-binding autotransporter adhesin
VHGIETAVPGEKFSLFAGYDHGKYFFAEAQAGYAFNNYDLGRGIAFGTINRTASSDADGHDVSAQLRIGAKLDSGGFNIVPSVSLRYDRLQRDGFTESGADSLNLTVESKRFTALHSSLGARASYPPKLEESGIEFEPYAGVYWQHDFRDSAVPVEARFSGIGIDVHGTEPGRDAAVHAPGRPRHQRRHALSLVASRRDFRRLSPELLTLFGRQRQIRNVARKSLLPQSNKSAKMQQ